MYFIQLIFVILPTTLKKYISKKSYCRFVFLLLFFLMGFRSKYIGLYDTEKIYLPWISLFKNLTIQDVLHTYPLYRGSLLQVLTKVYILITSSEELWIFLTSIPFCYAIYRLVYKESRSIKEATIYFTLIITLRLYSTQFFTIRHGLASAMLVFAYLAIREDKYIKYVFFTIMATLFHSTAIVFLLVVPFKLIDIKINWRYFISSIVILLGILYVLNNHFSLLFTYLDGSFSYYQNYQNEGGAAYTFPLIITCLYLMTFFLFKLKKTKNNDTLAFNLLALATITMYGSIVVSSFYRVSYFFLIFGCNSIKDAIVIQKKEIRLLIYVIVFGLLFYTYYLNLMSTNMIPYRTWLLE